MQIHVRSFIRGARTTLPVVMAGGSALPRGPASVACRCRQIDVVDALPDERRRAGRKKWPTSRLDFGNSLSEHPFTTYRGSLQQGRGPVEKLCDDLRRFAVQVRQIGFSVNGGVGERECLDLSDRMLAAVQQAESRVGNGSIEFEGTATPQTVDRRP
jgi:hypothetical protein